MSMDAENSKNNNRKIDLNGMCLSLCLCLWSLWIFAVSNPYDAYQPKRKKKWEKIQTNEKKSHSKSFFFHFNCLEYFAYVGLSFLLYLISYGMTNGQYTQYMCSHNSYIILQLFQLDSHSLHMIFRIRLHTLTETKHESNFHHFFSLLFIDCLFALCINDDNTLNEKRFCIWFDSHQIFFLSILFPISHKRWIFCESIDT